MASGNVFISYRRDDSGGYAGRLYDRLEARFPQRVFMDVTKLDPGVDFVDEIERAVGSCKALIVLMGKYWAVSQTGIDRLKDVHDFVRLEVSHALQRKIRVIPVLVGGAEMPAAATMPPELESLARRQALKLDDGTFDYNVTQLVEVLEKDLGPAIRPGSGPSRPAEAPKPEFAPEPQSVPRPVALPYSPAVHAKKSRPWLWVAAGACGVLAALGLFIAIALYQDFSQPADPEAIEKAMRLIGDATSNQMPPVGAIPVEKRSEQPAAQKFSSPPAVEESDSQDFQPHGDWQIALGEGAMISLLLKISPDGSFAAHTQGGGFSFPASAGNWQYDPQQRVLTAVGVNNMNLQFAMQFYIRERHGDHFHAFVPGSGNVVLTRQ